ncbi:uncharacterized protein LOC131320532 [Rhododendron vialii]|uniref:uncharacterized protein LOC131320532 n=1 Tax=Rhododendron vialii TaxID=182163 RepID=UPI00265DADC0|nr:uncharacterized protein LOC131320532 [Rhododendron vialii]
MASSLLATTAITLCSLISVYVSNTSAGVNSSSSDSVSLHGTTSTSSVKYFAILVCFLLGFLCNVQCLRYYAHVSFLATLPTSKDRRESIEYVVANLNRGSFFWSLGLRAFYLSFPLFLWVFGPISMFLCCCVMSVLLYFLDTTSSFTRILHSHSINVETKPSDVESVCQPSESTRFEDSNLQWPLLTSHDPVSTSAVAQRTTLMSASLELGPE